MAVEAREAAERRMQESMRQASLFKSNHMQAQERMRHVSAVLEAARKQVPNRDSDSNLFNIHDRLKNK
jgi:hypothetical protein